MNENPAKPVTSERGDFGCFLVFVVIVVAIVLGIWGWHIYFSNEQLIQNAVSQANHKEIVRLKKDVITCIKLDAQWNQIWAFKTCDDYELVTIQNTNEYHSGGRFGPRWTTESVEIWIKIRQPFILQLSYKNEDGRDTFLYVKLDFRD